MNSVEKVITVLKVFKAIVLKRKIPLAISWNITYKCNLRCGYCGTYEKDTKELDTKNVLAVIKEFAALGTKFIKFSGGEPLLREDLGKIIEYCRSKKFDVLLNSNGILVKDRIKEIRNIKEIQLSLDGEEGVHDSIRGNGSFKKTIEALEVCKRHGIKVIITTSLSRYNTSSVAFLIGIAKEYEVGIQFQPVDQMYSLNSSKDIRLHFSPNQEEFKNAITYIISNKIKGNKFIKNSLSGLRHIYHWPVPRKVKCLLGLIHCHVEPDGRVFICSEFPDYYRYLTGKDKNYREAFCNLAFPFQCKECWTSDVEYCMCADFKPDSILEMWGRLTA
ncbi:MAG: radical SAM protein [Candidatus Omnitrophica bacterium]|nr:radical SAM protein [Candidatus Omnitrophota bacterium]